MRLRFPQLKDQLDRALAPAYLLSGDEPLQLGEAAQTVRSKAAALGFDERVVLDQDAAFDWNELAGAADSMSLFSSRKLIDLRLSTPRIGKEGSAAVREYCERVNEDTVLLVSAPSLERKELRTKWVQEMDRVGVVLQVWPVEGEHLIRWAEQRLRTAGFSPEPGAAALLAERVEGNLLAAAQEIEKLRLLREPGPLPAADLLAAISDSARFDVFTLSDAALAGDRARVARVLAGLKAEGTASPLVLWALLRDLRLLAALAFARAQRQDRGAVFAEYRVWESRHPLVLKALGRFSLGRLRRLLQQCAVADRRIKGVLGGDPWQDLERIADQLAGAQPIDDPGLGLPRGSGSDHRAPAQWR